MPKIDPASSPSYSQNPSEQELKNKAKAIYHVLAPRKIHSSTLEGWSTRAAIHEMGLMLKTYKADLQQSNSSHLKQIDWIVYNLEYASSIQDLINVTDENASLIPQMICLKIAALKVGESLVFPGGYMGISNRPGRGNLPGHAILYEVIAEPNQKYSFIINNTGDGIGHHKTNTMSKRTQQLEYRNLDAQDLNGDFWFSICKLKKNPRRNVKDIYRFIDKKLNKHNGNKVSSRQIKFQRTGICAWKSISTWVHGKMAPGLKTKKRRTHEEIMYYRCKKNWIENKIQELKDPILQNYIKEHMVAHKKTFISSSIEKISVFFKIFFKKECKPHRYYQGEKLIELLNNELQQKKQRLEKKLDILIAKTKVSDESFPGD
ncbi:MAG: hypothetical protein BGO14_07695 [Chlamydiales bacterium 38-26]|nr:hypothetical protein [Chlamydiales bacterium]OJV10881.1 MAG: hypothetical protein BGO14_07695 [Chlamydiales bacterium 38-26]